MKECTFEKLYRIVGIITADYGMKHVYVFRFRACGDDTDSDYNFFVVPNDDCGMFRLTEFFGKLEEALGNVDIVCDDPVEGRDFTDKIFKETRLVYEA